jgi:hypothetical protein
MKSTELKKLIKEAVKEAIQEEMKDVLLEAVRAPQINNVSTPSPVMESNQLGTSTSNVAAPTTPSMNSTEQREAYQDILGGMSNGFTTNNVPQKFNPQGGAPGGDLPPGEVDMNQIMSIMGK